MGKQHHIATELNVLMIVPIVLLITIIILYFRHQLNPLIPWMIMCTLTFGSISIIAGGNGMV